MGFVQDREHTFAKCYPNAWRLPADCESGGFQIDEGQINFVTLRPHMVHDFTEPSGDEIFWRADGSCFDVGYRSCPIQQNGEIVGTVLTFSDITERKKAEEQLRQSGIVFAISQEAIMVTDPERNITMVNDAFTTITGFEAHEALKAIAGKWHTRLRRVSCEAVNGLGRKPKTGAQAKQGQRRAGIVRHRGATSGA